MIRRTLHKPTMQPHERWTAYVSLIAIEDYDSLSSIQRAAHLVFADESEVQNGGHLQYFLNSAGRRATDAIAALKTLGALDQAEILSNAVSRWQATDRAIPTTPEEYVEQALEGDFEDLDLRFYSCSPEINFFLERYLDQHETEFIDYGNTG